MPLLIKRYEGALRFSPLMTSRKPNTRAAVRGQCLHETNVVKKENLQQKQEKPANSQIKEDGTKFIGRLVVESSFKCQKEQRFNFTRSNFLQPATAMKSNRNDYIQSDQPVVSPSISIRSSSSKLLIKPVLTHNKPKLYLNLDDFSNSERDAEVKTPKQSENSIAKQPRWLRSLRVNDQHQRVKGQYNQSFDSTVKRSAFTNNSRSSSIEDYYGSDLKKKGVLLLSNKRDERESSLIENNSQHNPKRLGSTLQAVPHTQAYVNQSIEGGAHYITLEIPKKPIIFVDQTDSLLTKMSQKLRGRKMNICRAMYRANQLKQFEGDIDRNHGNSSVTNPARINQNERQPNQYDEKRLQQFLRTNQNFKSPESVTLKCLKQDDLLSQQAFNRTSAVWDECSQPSGATSSQSIDKKRKLALRLRSASINKNVRDIPKVLRENENQVEVLDGFLKGKSYPTNQQVSMDLQARRTQVISDLVKNTLVAKTSSIILPSNEYQQQHKHLHVDDQQLWIPNHHDLRSSSYSNKQCRIYPPPTQLSLEFTDKLTLDFEESISEGNRSQSSSRISRTRNNFSFTPNLQNSQQETSFYKSNNNQMRAVTAVENKRKLQMEKGRTKVIWNDNFYQDLVTGKENKKQDPNVSAWEISPDQEDLEVKLDINAYLEIP